MIKQHIQVIAEWRRRIFRVWIAVLLPAAAICGYLAYDHHKSIDVWQDLVSKRYEFLYSEEPSVTENFTLAYRQARFDDAVEGRERNRDARDTLVNWSIALSTFPAVLYIIYLSMMWLWFGSEKKMLEEESTPTAKDLDKK